ncbi:Ankyrin repeat domain-containing protein [Actinidia chinensis var. chinensis]|uniref:Ankyrin repeat domain-containing protein n=1 Tax=Actinidia chinensis var. chinensis TaxID=1590841 RepID=A0A2R6QE95_ACTCC|nr:Ankyrin repeat domain-containing protein [Actinidia chinensis var. chinensis]
MDETLRKSKQFHFPKKSIQILLSISAFSLLFSCFPFLPLLCNYFSNFSFQLFRYTTDRNYIFLFCNGILVFLIRNSVMAATSPLGTIDTNPEPIKRNVDVVEVELEKGRGNENLVTEEGEENDILTEDQVIVEEDVEEEGMGLLSAEELKKKCDDFIRKMREGIKSEAQQLVMV